MHYLLPLLLSLPLTPSTPDDLVPGEVVEGELAFQLDEFLTRLEGLGFSGVVGVEFEGRPILLRGYGLADRERGLAVTPDTVFCTGSITKQFTAAAILALQDEGKLSVEDSLAKHFENVPEDKRGLTLHHLLTHTSGLVDPPAGDYDLRATAAWVRDWALGCQLEWEPGQEYGYRNVNFSLLGMVIERVSGEGYEAFLRRRLFERAGLASSHAAREQLETPFADEGGGTSYGYGWSIQTSPSGKKLVAHNGGNTVFFADFLRFVEEGHCIFLATNVGSRMRQSLAYELAGILYGRAPRALPETLERDREWLERYAGRYSLGEESALEIVNLGDRLVLTGSGSEAAELLCDEKTRARIDEVRALAAAVCAGDDRPFLEAYRGRQTPESVRSELSAARAGWAKRLGAFRETGEATARPGENTRVVVEARFERGSGYLSLDFGPAGRLFAFECLDEAPFRGQPRIELFPLTSVEFRAYDDRAGLGTAVRFELGEDGRALALALGEPPVSVAKD